MGTEARIVLYAQSRERAEDAARAAFARIAALDAVLSDYRNESELVTALLKGKEVPLPLSDDLFTVLRASLALSEETKGAFDVTVGVLTGHTVNARYTRDPRTGVVREMPGCAVLRRVGWKSVELDTTARTVTFKQGGMRIDLGGIAKGYAADEALEVLRAHKVDRALVSIGGDLVAGRAPPDADGWRIEVANADTAHATMVIANQAVSTSGDTEQHVDSGGVRYSHVIDPRTGVPLTSRVAATVLAPTGVEADGWSTAVTVLRDSARARFIAAHPEATFYVRTITSGPAPARPPPAQCVIAE
ncbi:MAG TPA: FAD:protein FMN transferase [Gemmatimonadaceae bacterium]|nr:FAD:protein FMN transferase [Gemmatimonadaceae bacterium]